MGLVEVTGITKEPATLYYINVGGGKIQVSEECYDEMHSSLSNGDIWVYSEDSHEFYKKGTQLSLLSDELEG